MVEKKNTMVYTTAAQVSIVLNHSNVTVTLSADISLHILRISLGALGWMQWRNCVLCCRLLVGMMMCSS